MLKEVETHTAVGPDRCFILYQLAKHAISRIGDIAEIGVYRGGTARLLAKTTNKPVHIFDTFGGMPVTDKEKDLHCAGDFSDTSFQFVKKYLEDCTNLKIYPGFFPIRPDLLQTCNFALFTLTLIFSNLYMTAVSFFIQELYRAA